MLLLPRMMFGRLPEVGLEVGTRQTQGTATGGKETSQLLGMWPRETSSGYISINKVSVSKGIPSMTIGGGSDSGHVPIDSER